MSKEMPFLKNPPRSALKARRKRRPVKRVTKRRTNTAKNEVATMARKKHRRHTRRRNPVGVRRHAHVARTHRRRHRRNPPGGIMGTVTTGLTDGLWGLGGNFATRYLSSMFGMGPASGYTGLLAEAALGVVGALTLRKFAPAGSRAFLQGAFMAPMASLAKSVLPVSMTAYLGDGGEYNALVPGGSYNNGGIDPAVQVGMQGYPQLQGYPEDARMGAYAGYAGYAEDGMGDFDSMAGQYGR